MHSLFVHNGHLVGRIFEWAPSRTRTRHAVKNRYRFVANLSEERRSASFSDLRDSSGVFEVRKGGIVVPRHLWNHSLRRKGVYRSVEYRVLSLSLSIPGKPLEMIDSSLQIPDHATLKNVTAELQPLSRLRPRFERDWPVSVNADEAKLYSYKLDILTCLAATLSFSLSSLILATIVPAYFVSLSLIPSASMAPFYLPGDAVVVEKVSLHNRKPQRGEVILFRPPDTLLKMVRDRGTRLRRGDLFVKRVAAVGGDRLAIVDGMVTINGHKIEKAAGARMKGIYIIPEGFLYVLGDNEDHSYDSRYWGLLPVDLVEGRPLGTIWPPKRIACMSKR